MSGLAVEFYKLKLSEEVYSYEEGQWPPGVQGDLKLYTILDLKKQQQKNYAFVLRVWLFIGLEMELRLSFFQQYHISYYSCLSADLCTETSMGNVWNSD